MPGLAFAEPIVTVHPSGYSHDIDVLSSDSSEIQAVPGNASLVDQTQWSGQRGATLKDLTDYVPGVYTQPRNGAESSRLSIRGSGLANIFQGRGLMVMQDGVPINMADGEFEFPVIDPWLIRYAKILPGASALEEGASTLGGAIDFVTPTGMTAHGYGLRAEGGSFGTAHGLTTAGQEWQDSDMFAALSGFHQDGFRDQNTQDNLRFNANLGWRPSDSVSQRFYISHTVSNAEIPGALSKAEIDDSPSQANPANRNGLYERNLDITRLAYRANWQGADDIVESTFYYTYRTLDNPVTTYLLENNNDVGARFKFTRTLGLNKLTTGLNISYGTQDESRYANVGGNRGAHILERKLDALTSEIYAQYDQHLYEHIYGIASLQGAFDTRNISQSFPVTASQDRTYASYNPRIGLRYDINQKDQIFVNLSRSFEPPSWTELSGGNAPGFNSLEAQTATTAELGARGSESGINWSAAVYHSRLSNEFINYRFANGATDTINAQRTIHNGAEVGINGDILQLSDDTAFNFRLAYTYSDFHLDDDPLYRNNQLPGMPKHYLRSELIYKDQSSGVSFGPNIEWTPSAYPVDLTNTLKADRYAIYGARASWAVNERIETYIEGRNLLDSHYIATTNVLPDAAGLDSRSFYPGEGRAFYAGLKIAF